MALLMGVACTLGMFAVGARAGSLEILVTESGGPTIPILDNGALDTDPTVGVINVLLQGNSGLNLLLNQYQFTQLGANSNSPGGGNTGFVTQTGVAQLLVGGTGSVTVLASDVDYNVPPAGPGTLHTSSTAEFTNATNGNTNGFRGWFNPSNTLGNKEVPSGAISFNASGQPAADPHMSQNDRGITLVHPYGLTNETVITLTGGSAGALAQDRFGGTVQTFSAPIPEPASMALMLGALPVLVFGLMRRRRAAA
jgi:hypothetical protein